MTKTLPFGLLWFPGMRAKAYLNVFQELNVRPSVIICLKNSRSEIAGLAKEAKKNEYNKYYFDVNYELSEYLRRFDVPVIETDACSINDDAIYKVLNRQTEKNWIFCGGGILKKHLFTNGLKYLHVHPGELPQYRGSTCFYYSLLSDMTLSASAFYLSPKLDDGEVLLTTDFKVNVQINEKNQLFLDHILDPWIRSVVLKKLLLKILSEQPIKLVSHPASEKRAYYVMHPILRCMTAKTINKHYDKTKDYGVTVIK